MIVGEGMGKLYFFRESKTIYFQVLKILLLIFIMPFFILLIVYAGLTRNIERQTCLRNLDIVRAGAESIERMLGNQENLAVFFECSQDILNFYYRADPLVVGSTTKDVIEAQSSLSVMGIANSDTLNIQMYAARSGALIDYSTCALFPERYYGGKFQLAGMDYNIWLNEVLLNEKQRVFIEAEMSFQGNTREVLIYNRKYANGGSGNYNDRIIFYIDGQKLKKEFLAAQYEEGFLAVMDNDGMIVLSDRLTDEKFQYLANAEFSEEGYCKCKINGKKMLLVNHYSDTLGFTYILAVPYSDIRAAVKPLTSTMKCLIILSGLIGILLVIQLSAHFSRPLEKVHKILDTTEKNASLEDFTEKLVEIVKGNEIMKAEMQSLQELLQYEAFRNVVMGNVTESAEIKTVLAQSGMKQDEDHYVLLILNWNDLDTDINIEEISAQKVYMENIVHSMEKGEVEFIFQLDMEKTIVILSYTGCSLADARNRAESLIRHVMEESVKNINYSISVAGDVIVDLEHLSKGFFHAKKALSVSPNIFRNSPIQWYDMAKIYLKTVEQGEEEYNSAYNIRTVEEIQKYIDDHFFDSGLSLTSIAEKFFITEAYVSKLFKRVSGQNFSKYIEKIRMENAQILIQEGKAISEVSSLVGYNSPQVFRRAWKRYYSGLPSKSLPLKEDEEEING